MDDLDRVFEDLDRLDAPVSWAQVANRPPAAPPSEPRRPRKVLVATFALVVAVAGMSLLVGAFVRPGRHPVRPAKSGSPTPSATVPPPASIVGGSGLVESGGPFGTIFCGGAFLAILTPGPPACGTQVQAVGVDLSALSNKVTRNGVTWGSAYLAGSFSNGILNVTEQGPPRQPISESRFFMPPCPSPAGGWAISPNGEPPTAALNAYTRRFRQDVTSFAWFHPTTSAWVGTIASTDPKRTTAMLGPQYPRQLCVVSSRYTKNEVRGAKAAATALLMQRLYEMFGVGIGVGDNGQPVVDVEAALDTPELRAALASQPAGLVHITPWLAPLPSRASADGSAVIFGHLYAAGGMSTGMRPLNGTVRAAGAEEFTVQVGTDGSYTITLPPGRYTLTGRSPLYNGGTGICQATTEVSIQPGQRISVDVLCQEK